MSAPPTLVALPPSFINYTDHITSSAFLLGVVALVALHFLLRATDASHFARHWLWPCFLHLFRDPAGDTANSSVPASLELGLGKTVEQQQREQETNGAVARWLARINGAIVEEETTPRWIQQPDPMRLSAVLSVVILAHALGAFGTLLVFPVDGITGELDARESCTPEKTGYLTSFLSQHVRFSQAGLFSWVNSFASSPSSTSRSACATLVERTRTRSSYFTLCLQYGKVSQASSSRPATSTSR